MASSRGQQEKRVSALVDECWCETSKSTQHSGEEERAKEKKRGRVVVEW